jgi:hypothetical protein
MAITGAHALIYTPEAEALRLVLRDVLGWDHVEGAPGWLIFALPPAEVAVHPADRPGYELSLMCDDLTATISELSAKGVHTKGPPTEQAWGTAVTVLLPGGVEMILYQPRHPTAI